MWPPLTAAIFLFRQPFFLRTGCPDTAQLRQCSIASKQACRWALPWLCEVEAQPLPDTHSLVSLPRDRLPVSACLGHHVGNTSQTLAPHQRAPTWLMLVTGCHHGLLTTRGACAGRKRRRAPTALGPQVCRLPASDGPAQQLHALHCWYQSRLHAYRI